MGSIQKETESQRGHQKPGLSHQQKQTKAAPPGVIYSGYRPKVKLLFFFNSRRFERVMTAAAAYRQTSGLVRSNINSLMTHDVTAEV